MRRILPLILLISFISVQSYAQPVIEWAANYAGNAFNHYTKDMAMDEEGNVYVTGTLVVDSVNNDFITLKYDKFGNLAWARTYDGPQSGEDEPAAIKVDNFGNVVVAGTSRDTTGPPVKTYSAVIKYSPSGDTLWTRRYINQDSLFNLVNGIQIDTNSNIYVLSESWRSNESSNVLLTKYSIMGDLEWQNELDAIGTYDTPRQIKLDRNNNIATYSSTGIGGMLIKYNHQGDSIWGLHITPQAIRFMEFDNLNNVYLGGTVSGVPNGTDYYSVKYNLSANLLWERRYQSSSYNNADHMRATFLDDSSNFYVTGVSAQTGLLGWDYLTIKYSTDGDSLWVKRFAEIPRSNDEPVSVAADKNGNVFVTGKSDRFILINRISTPVYAPSGEHLYTLHYDTNYFFTPYEPVKMEIDSAGSVYISGISRNSFGKIDMITLKYSPVVSSIQNVSGEIPSTFQLSQNYPNPFNNSTNIKFSIIEKGLIKLEIFDFLGRRIDFIEYGNREPGSYTINYIADKLSSGVYFYRIKADDFIQTKKMLLVK